MPRIPLPVLLPLLLAAALAAGCNDDAAAPGGNLPADAAPDFSLVDVNPTSATFAQGVSPRDHLQRVSAWYFGHAT